MNPLSIVYMIGSLWHLGENILGDHKISSNHPLTKCRCCLYLWWWLEKLKFTCSEPRIVTLLFWLSTAHSLPTLTIHSNGPPMLETYTAVVDALATVKEWSYRPHQQPDVSFVRHDIYCISCAHFSSPYLPSRKQRIECWTIRRTTITPLQHDFLNLSPSLFLFNNPLRYWTLEFFPSYDLAYKFYWNLLPTTLLFLCSIV